MDDIDDRHMDLYALRAAVEGVIAALGKQNAESVKLIALNGSSSIFHTRIAPHVSEGDDGEYLKRDFHRRIENVFDRAKRLAQS